MSLPLSKTLHPDDYILLRPELENVNRNWDGTQHDHRRWEYAMALRAVDNWMVATGYGHPDAADVGGAGSPLFWMLKDRIAPDDLKWQALVIDPAANPSCPSYTLAAYVTAERRTFQIVTAISLLEHVEDLDHFGYHLSCLVAPGGLLFLTMDCCDAPGGEHGATDEFPTDRYHFSWMRRRIFGVNQVHALAEDFWDRGFTLFGRLDRMYHGNHVFDYSFCSLALVKRA